MEEVEAAEKARGDEEKREGTSERVGGGSSL